jgi:predicted O-methyltransferase YrrM
VKNRIDVFLELFREELPEYLRDLEKKAISKNVPILGHTTADILRFYLRSLHVKNVLEIGTAVGYSALFMRECANDLFITTIEKIDQRYEEALNNFKKYDKDSRITPVKADAMDAIVSLKKEKKRFGLIFLDAAKGQYSAYLPILIDLMDEGGVLIADNIFHNGAVVESRYAVTQRDRTIHDRLREFLKDITEHEKLDTLILPVEDGVAICQKNYTK